MCADVKLEWLKTFLALPGGAPSHDTFRRVFGLLDRGQFAANLFRWTRGLHEATGGKLIAIDGGFRLGLFLIAGLLLEPKLQIAYAAGLVPMALGLGEGGRNEDDEYFDLLPNI